MITPTAIWICVATLITTIVLARLVWRFFKHSHTNHPQTFIEMSNELEEFWIPGDPNPSDKDDL